MLLEDITTKVFSILNKMRYTRGVYAIYNMCIRWITFSKFSKKDAQEKKLRMIASFFVSKGHMSNLRRNKLLMYNYLEKCL